MLSNVDLERLITIKRREIEKEKTWLGLASKTIECQSEHPPTTKEEGTSTTSSKQVKFDTQQQKVSNKYNYDNDHFPKEDKNEKTDIEPLPPDLERYIRRYLGLPVMLKAGEYSPNNPLVRDDRQRGTRDVFVGLGEYEERSHTLRKIRQKEYRLYLEQQSKLKQEAKEREEKERLEREQREKERERLIQERERKYNYVPEREIYTKYTDINKHEQVREDNNSRSATHTVKRDSYTSTSELERRGFSKVDTGVQVNGKGVPMSVGVQTDEDLYHGSPDTRRNLTLAERELSPRTVLDKCEYTDGNQTRNTDYDYDAAPKSNRAKLMSDLGHTYLPSIIDGDAIQTRNTQQQQAAAQKRLCYQQELKNQIEEQQRIREERKARERMLEEAELRRLDEQLKMLRLAQDRETDKQQLINVKLRDHNKEFNNLKISLQRDIDKEKHTLFKSIHQPEKRIIHTTNDNYNHNTKLPFYYPSLPIRKNKKPYSVNIPDNSLFSKNYNLENHLKKHLNPSRETLFSNTIDKKSSSNIILEIDSIGSKIDTSTAKNDSSGIERNSNDKSPYEPSFLRKDIKDLIVKTNNNLDDTPIPVLRHSPKLNVDRGNEIYSDPNNNDSKMRVVENKWQVPAVQKNILKTIPSAGGDKVNILTQLGSIRRQLQMEQLRLDQMLSKRVSD